MHTNTTKISDRVPTGITRFRLSVWQVSAGLLPPDSNICLDASKIEGLVVCRPDEVRKSPEEILGGCAGHDVFCPKDTNGTDYTCICNPCKPACENGKVLTSGTCSCPTSTVEMGGSCVPTAVLALVIAFPTLMLLFACFYVSEGAVFLRHFQG